VTFKNKSTESNALNAILSPILIWLNYLVWLLKTGKGWNEDSFLTPGICRAGSAPLGVLELCTFQSLVIQHFPFPEFCPQKCFTLYRPYVNSGQNLRCSVGFHERPVRMLSHGPCPVGCWRILKLPERTYLRVWSTRRPGYMMKCAPIAAWRNNQMSTLRYWKVWKCNGDEENTFFKLAATWLMGTLGHLHCSDYEWI